MNARRHAIPIALLGLSICGLVTAAQPPMASAHVSLDSHRWLGAPMAYRNLTLIPVYDRAARSSGEYVTLDEGLKARTVIVQESQGGGMVNTLTISNIGRKPLYIMAGEVVLGGQQDRCLGQDMLVAAGKRHVPITVFCVEHGRRTGEVEFGASAPAAAAADIRFKTQEGAFAGASPAAHGTGGIVATRTRVIGGITTNSLRGVAEAGPREASISSAQQRVWDSVAAKNQHFNAESGTSTYRKILSMAAPEARQSVEPYIKALAACGGPNPHLAGMIAAVNGTPVAADAFGDTALFRKLWPKLLRSYAADAAENAPTSERRLPRVTAVSAREFFVSASSAKTVERQRTKMSTIVRKSAGANVLYELTPSSAASGENVPALHQNVLKNR